MSTHPVITDELALARGLEFLHDAARTRETSTLQRITAAGASPKTIRVKLGGALIATGERIRGLPHANGGSLSSVA